MNPHVRQNSVIHCVADPQVKKNEAAGMKNEWQLQKIDRHRSKQADLQVKEMKSVSQTTMGDSCNIRLVIQWRSYERYEMKWKKWGVQLWQLQETEKEHQQKLSVVFDFSTLLTHIHEKVLLEQKHLLVFLSPWLVFNLVINQ